MSSRLQRLCIALAVASIGCSSFRTADLGYANSPLTGRQQLMARGRSLVGDEHWLYGYEVRGRAGPNAQQLAVGWSFAYQPSAIGARLLPHIGWSATFLELGHVARAFELSGGDPSAELGMTWMVDNDTRYTDCSFRIWAQPGQRGREPRQLKQKGWGLTLGSSALVDIHFLGQQPEVFWMVTLGVSEVIRLGTCEHPD